ncbi:MAG: hypothetical protein ABJG68_07650 [Crocinitomicaceae bacterium]
MKVKLILFLFLLSTFTFSCKKGKNNPESCNGSSTRRDIKLVIDEAADDVDTIPIFATIDSLGSVDLPKAKSDLERQEIEKHVFTVTGTVEKVKKYRDGDYHIKLVDEDENFMNCESPNFGCSYAPDSRFFEQFKTVREWIEEHEEELVGKELTITGVGFIDIDHKYPRNAAPNEIELHPILDIGF